MASQQEKGGEEEARRKAKETQKLDKVLEADEESFPASDAPSWTASAEGRPHYEPPPEEEEKPRGEPPR